MIARLDRFLLLRVFMPIAHWVDYRWHFNQYRLASGVVKAALAMDVANVANTFCWNTSWLDAVLVPFPIFMIYLFSDNIKRFDRMAHLAEGAPVGTIPAEAAIYVLMPSRLRILMFASGFLCGALMAAPVVPAIAYMIVRDATGFWLAVLGTSWYFAACPPPSRGRKKKKERTPWAAPLLKAAKATG